MFIFKHPIATLHNHVSIFKRPVVALQNHVSVFKRPFATNDTPFQIHLALSHSATPISKTIWPYCSITSAVSKTDWGYCSMAFYCIFNLLNVAVLTSKYSLLKSEYPSKLLLKFNGATYRIVFSSSFFTYHTYSSTRDRVPYL